MITDKYLPVMGYNVFCGKLSEVNYSQKTLINTFSPNSYGVALNDKRFEKALKGSDLLVLDGIGVAFASVFLNGKNIKKVAGQDCFDYFIDQVNQKSGKCFFFGSTEKTLQKIKDRLAVEYPNVTVGYYSPPFKPEFTDEDNVAARKAINDFAPDVLFVGLTAPKQEKWAFENKDYLNVPVISTIGNVFDWYAGNSKRPAKIWVKLRLEWLVRIFLRPEIFKRNTGNQMLFVRDFLLVFFKLKKI
ncbi:MAG: WecB/TagA/CpsF family glycosyltransferase [Bacteroidetes bacterium]|nr:WecB/TagA/CpsF family glycosyltransferase [Bacteroidota bacterium]